MSLKTTIKTELADVEGVERAIAKALHRHWALYLFEGIVLVVLGGIAILVPPLAMVAVTILLGWVFLISGVIGLFTTIWLREGPGFWWSLASAILGIVVGLILFAMPVEGGALLTVLLVAFFVIEGATSILFALEHKRELSGKWEWMLLSGVIDLSLGGVIVYNLPSPTAWAIGGMLVGINMLFGGIALIVMALHARDQAAVAA
jgi:uncharacterized membrane protein HdeD (DUF308 family)